MLHHHHPPRMEPPAWPAAALPPRAGAIQPRSRRATAALTVRPINADAGDTLTLDLAGSRYAQHGSDLFLDDRRIGRVTGGGGGAPLRVSLAEGVAEHEPQLLERLRYTNRGPAAPYSRAFLITTAAPKGATLRREAVNAAWLPALADTLAAAVAEHAARGHDGFDGSGRLRPVGASRGVTAVDRPGAAAVLLAALQQAFGTVAARRPAAGEAVDTPAPTRMSPRQREVLRLVAAGRSNKQIALDLGVSPATVKTHVACVLATIGARNRTDAAIKARERGWI
jgi:DNA-binding NarL/FixJ family response regulator